MGTPAPLLVEAAVLAPVFRDGHGEPYLVLVRRTAGGLHGGQLALPGGRREPDDASPLATALREADEEIGLSPHAVHVLAALPVIETRTTGYRIAPFLGRIDRPPAWRLAEDEIAEVIEVRVADLARPEARGEGLEHFRGWPDPIRIRFLRVGPHRLWGATFRILEPLLPRLLAGDWAL
jgi:8-oxo-dGTP pyrophosphatase MutT (NUDIX family)